MRKLLLVLLLLLVCAVAGSASGPRDAFEVRVLSIVDGDTVDVRVPEPPQEVWPRERVRLLGFDAPEIGEPFATEATRLVRELVRSGRTWLQLDQQLRDPYVRLLAHLWVEVDGEWLLIGEEVLRAGLGWTLFIPPNSLHWDRLREAELEAQSRGVGLWEVYAEPLTLRRLESDPVTYVTEVIAVRFEIGEVEELSAGAILHAAASRFGFHAVVEPEAWRELTAEVDDPVGTRVEVRGELDWRRLDAGPFIRVEVADQIEPVEEWPSGEFVHGPYTGAPEEEAVTVSWTASPPLPGRVVYGPWEEFEHTGTLAFSEHYSPVEAGDRGTAHVQLQDLEPGTSYAYRVILDGHRGAETSPAGRFHTAPQAGESVSFAVIADTQWQWDGVNRIRLVGDALAADSDELDFILHGGDLVESPIPRYWDHFFLSLSDALLKAPLLPVLGNHEGNSRSYYELFALPPGGGRMDKRWWALEYGDVAVVGLDTNVSRPGDYLEQVEFMRGHLSGDHQYRFVIFHHPVFSSDAIYGPGMEGLQTLFHPVFAELGVDIVFTGHAHNYERIERDGVTYLIVGGGGATVRPLADDLLPDSVVANDEHLFYVKVHAGPDVLEVDVVAVAEQVDDTVVSAWGLLDSFAR